VRNARTALRASGVEFEERDYGKKPLPREEALALVRAAGGVASVLNARHAIAKERGWKDSPPSIDELVDAWAKEPNLLRRPILLAGKKAIVGFDEKAYSELAAR
jgi:arsenate reductase-like glutaredoxin family protein